MSAEAEGRIIELAHEVRCLTIRLALREIDLGKYQQEFDRLFERYQELNSAARGSVFKLMDDDLSPVAH